MRLDRSPLFDEFGAQNAGQQAERQRRREQQAVALDEDVAPASFGHESRFVDEHDFGGAVRRARRVIGAAKAGLVGQPEIARSERRRRNGDRHGQLGKPRQRPHLHRERAGRRQSHPPARGAA